MDIKYPVNCPLMGGCSIDIGTCFDIHMVVSGEAPKWTVPEKIYETPNFKDVCSRCQYHRED